MSNEREDMSPVQAAVMKWIDGGWTAYCDRGAVVTINGQRACTVATMEALERKGLVSSAELESAYGFPVRTFKGLPRASEAA
jgi:hypothetical protein